MAAIATEDNKGQLSSAAFPQRTGQRDFTVIQASSKDEAVAAVANPAVWDTELNQFVAVGLPWQTTSGGYYDLLCERVTAEQIGPTTYHATATYRVSPTGEIPLDVPALDQPPRVKWTPILTSEQFDNDINAMPILNSAGDPYQGGSTKNVLSWEIEIKKYVASYVPATWAGYINHVNSAGVTFTTIKGSPTFAAGSLYCRNVTATDPYPTVSYYVQLGFLFEYRPTTEPNLTALQQAHPFYWRNLDQGMRGWYSKSGTPTSGAFYDSGGNQVSTPVLLDGTGVPCDSSFTVLGNSPIASPNPFSGESFPPLVDVIAGPPKAVFIMQPRYAETSFSGMGL